MHTRVRVSELNGTDDVSENGSAFIVTDSKATARVFAVWLMRVGFLVVAAVAVKMQINRTNWEINILAAQRGKLVFIQEWAPSRFPKRLLISGEVLLARGATLVNNPGSRQYIIFYLLRDRSFRRLKRQDSLELFSLDQPLCRPQATKLT